MSIVVLLQPIHVFPFFDDDDDDDFVGFGSLCALGIDIYIVWTIREKESNTRRSGYKPRPLLRIDLLGSFTCPV